MKRFLLCLLVVGVMILPGMAQATDPTSGMVDVKAYGNQTGDYSAGVLNFNSTTYTNSYGSSQNWTSFANSVSSATPCTGANCGMGITQGNYSVDNYTSTQTTNVTGKNLTGAANMTSMGGIAACTTPAYNYCGSIPMSGSFSQTQTVNSSVSGPVDLGINASGSYTGTQTLNLHVGH